MKANKINRIGMGLAFVFAMAFGLILVSGTEANAQGRSGRNNRQDDTYRGQRDRDWDNDDRINGRDRNGNQSTKFAYKRGYQAGRKAAREQMRNGGYNNGTYGRYPNDNGRRNGNRGGWGSDGAFQQAYSEGYNRGYQDAINNNRNNNRNNDPYYNGSRRQSGIGRILGLPF